MEKNNPSHKTAESLITSAVDSVKHTAEHQIHRVEVYTRRAPLMAVAMSAAAGYVLRSLPVMALTGVMVRLALVLVRPFIFILGAVNIYEFLRSRNAPSHDSRSGEEYVPGKSGKH